MRTLSTLILILAVSACVSPARGQSIGLFFDPAGTICSIHIPPPSSGKGLQLPPPPPSIAYVIADLGGGVTNPCAGTNPAPLGGLTDAEFRLVGWPSQLIALGIPNPDATGILGDPFLGTHMAFPTCQTGGTWGAPAGKVILYQIPWFATGLVPPSIITVQALTTPSRPACPCPLMTLCDDPTFSATCSPGGTAAINFVPFSDPCAVGVQANTWSGVKGLYRD